MHFLQPAVLNFRQRFCLIFSQAEVWIQVGLENLGQVSLKVYAVKLILLKLKNKWADYQAPNRSHWAFSYHCISSYVVFGDWCGAVSFLGKHEALSSWACFASMLTELYRSPAWGWASPVCVCWLLMGWAAQSWASSHWLNIFGFVPNTMSILHEGRTRRLLRNALESTGGWSDVNLYHWATEPVSPIGWGGFSIYI